MTHVTKARIKIALMAPLAIALAPLIILAVGATYAFFCFMEGVEECMRWGRYCDDQAGPPWIWLNGKKTVIADTRVAFEWAVQASGVPDADVVTYSRAVVGDGTLIKGEAIRVLHGTVINVARTVAA